LTSTFGNAASALAATGRGVDRRAQHVGALAVELAARHADRVRDPVERVTEGVGACRRGKRERAPSESRRWRIGGTVPDRIWEVSDVN
jgi:hypothetical protein